MEWTNRLDKQLSIENENWLSSKDIADITVINKFLRKNQFSGIAEDDFDAIATRLEKEEKKMEKWKIKRPGHESFLCLKGKIEALIDSKHLKFVDDISLHWLNMRFDIDEDIQSALNRSSIFNFIKGDGYLKYWDMISKSYEYLNKYLHSKTEKELPQAKKEEIRDYFKSALKIAEERRNKRFQRYVDKQEQNYNKLKDNKSKYLEISKASNYIWSLNNIQTSDQNIEAKKVEISNIKKCLTKREENLRRVRNRDHNWNSTKILAQVDLSYKAGLEKEIDNKLKELNKELKLMEKEREDLISQRDNIIETKWMTQWDIDSLKIIDRDTYNPSQFTNYISVLWTSNADYRSIEPEVFNTSESLRNYWNKILNDPEGNWQVNNIFSRAWNRKYEKEGYNAGSLLSAVWFNHTSSDERSAWAVNSLDTFKNLIKSNSSALRKYNNISKDFFDSTLKSKLEKKFPFATANYNDGVVELNITIGSITQYIQEFKRQTLDKSLINPNGRQNPELVSTENLTIWDMNSVENIDRDYYSPKIWMDYIRKLWKTDAEHFNNSDKLISYWKDIVDNYKLLDYKIKDKILSFYRAIWIVTDNEPMSNATKSPIGKINEYDPLSLLCVWGHIIRRYRDISQEFFDNTLKSKLKKKFPFALVEYSKGVVDVKLTPKSVTNQVRKFKSDMIDSKLTPWVLVAWVSEQQKQDISTIKNNLNPDWYMTTIDAFDATLDENNLAENYLVNQLCEWETTTLKDSNNLVLKKLAELVNQNPSLEIKYEKQGTDFYEDDRLPGHKKSKPYTGGNIHKITKGRDGNINGDNYSSHTEEVRKLSRETKQQIAQIHLNNNPWKELKDNNIAQNAIYKLYLPDDIRK